MKLEVAVVEIIKARVAAHQARLGDRADEEDRRRRAVIRPLRGVFLDPAAEFAEGRAGRRGLPGRPRRGRRERRRPNRTARSSSAACVPSWLAWVSKPSSEV